MSLHQISLGTPLTHVERRPLPEAYNDPNLKAICYSAYRGSGPGTGEVITDAMIRQDLNLLKLAGFTFIRMFGSDDVTHSVLRIMRDEFPGDFLMHMTIYLAGDGPINCQTNPINIAQLNTGVALANEYDEIIVAVGVGNETSLAGNLPISCLVQYITYVKARIQQPVTTDDWHTFWKSNQCHPVLPIIDFVSLHTYAITDFQYWDWYQLDIDEGPPRGIASMEASFQYSVDEYDATYNNTYYYQNEFVTIGETLPIIIGETGWKYKQTNNYQTDEQYLAKPVNEKWFFDKMYEWQQSGTGPKTIIWFEAFNENWKGQDSGWGLWDENRVPQYALCATPAAGNPCDYPDPYQNISYFKQNGIGGSLAFGGMWDNSGQWISFPANTAWTFSNTANFTIEWWQRQVDFSYGNYPRVFSVGDYPNISIGASITDGELGVWIGNQYSPAITYQFNFGVLVNNWVHIAIERYNGILKIYVNGSPVASKVDSSVADNSTLPLFIGASQPPGDPYTRFPGNITNFRFVNGEAVYKGTFIPPSYPLQVVGNSNTKILLLSSKSSTYLTDNSIFQRTATNSTGVPTTWSTFNPFVGGSYYFPGSGPNMTVAANNAFNFSQGDFTVEWYQLQTQFGTYFYPRVFTFGTYPNIQFGVTHNANTFQLWAGGGGSPIMEMPLPDSVINLWRHFVVQRANNQIKVYINGLVANTINNNTSIVTTGTPLYIGAEPGAAGPYTYFPGYITNFRMENSAVYDTDVILIPVSPLQPTTNTIFLAQAFNSSEYLYDSSNNHFTITTDPQNPVIYSSYSPFGD